MTSCPFSPEQIEGIRAVWAAIDGDNLPRWEQSVLIKQMTGILNDQSRPPTPAHRLNAKEIIEDARSFTDE